MAKELPGLRSFLLVRQYQGIFLQSLDIIALCLPYSIKKSILLRKVQLMRQSHSLFHFSGIFGTIALLFCAMAALVFPVCSQSPNILEKDDLAYRSFSNSKNLIYSADSDNKIKSTSQIEHVDGTAACLPTTDLIIPDNNSSREDSFHHRSRLVNSPGPVSDLITSSSDDRVSKSLPLELPQFITFAERQNFNYSIKPQELNNKDNFLKKGDLKGFDPFDDDISFLEDFADNDPVVKEKFHWRPAIQQSLMMLGVQHGYALVAQEKTRRALKGPFFRDYWRSLKGLSGWDDGNRFFTNYIAHPMQGAMTGFIYVQNHDRVKKQKFAESPEYWRDRLKIFAWSTAWSTQWELGPISQSTIGNLGMYGGMGYVDLVMTPTAGTAWLMTEEALDRYVIRHIESKSKFIRIMARMFLNPMRTTANLLRFREPWYRDRPMNH